MKLAELIPFLGDKVILYKFLGEENEEGELYADIFNGRSSDIPQDLRTLKVGTVGAKRKGVLDVEVRQ